MLHLSCSLMLQSLEGGGDEVALAVVGSDGPGVDNGCCLTMQRFVACGGVHEGELPCTLGVALYLGQDVPATGKPFNGLCRVLQGSIAHEHERGMLTGDVDR